MNSRLGARALAESILRLIETEKANNKTDAEILKDVIKKVEYIRRSERDGWY